MSPDFVYLASESPRRRALLAQIGVRFQPVASTVDESVRPGEPAHDYVTRLARAKAAAGRLATAALPRPVLAADTTVVLDGIILGKPRDRSHSEQMLLALSDRTHEVLTAVAVAGVADARTAAPLVAWRLSRSSVTFRRISVSEARDYWDTGEPLDKAGGYAVQGLAAVFIAVLTGSYSGVMGLPLYEAAELLTAVGVPMWHAGTTDEH